ncbi:hypothetical protein KSS87_007248, partial [Heliosperma pusillum]
MQAILAGTHTRTVRSCAWSPSGKMLATASFDATTAVWGNIGGGYECVSTLEGQENEVKSVSLNAAGSLIATCGRDKSVWIWEVEPGNEFECLSVLQGHTQDVKMIQCHPSVDALFSCSYDNSIKIWAQDGDDDWHCVQTLNEASKTDLEGKYLPPSFFGNKPRLDSIDINGTKLTFVVHRWNALLILMIIFFLSLLFNLFDFPLSIFDFKLVVVEDNAVDILTLTGFVPGAQRLLAYTKSIRGPGLHIVKLDFQKNEDDLCNLSVTPLDEDIPSPPVPRYFQYGTPEVRLPMDTNLMLDSASSPRSNDLIVWLTHGRRSFHNKS